ncbi:chloramphenicol acetyltransferase [Flavobacterium cucumis]|uniref:Chloramphenicol O-acetyltransferase type A n=1 Tax=Flavobacterium cucumis TaxID=416016 RepID=A0A1M7ZTW4_9FLAO|nr:chloramphenicol acetyltransferase [Flavobacterium cucumis]SHO72339.1 chloramphenicol O-acetyltransferase type A [Flavobacterium cucumis]
MKTEIDINTWNRKEHFEFFSAFDEPFFGITTPVNCTIAMKRAKEIEIPFFVYYLHKTLEAINKVENFRLRIENKEVYLYNEIDASATIMREDKTFGFSFMKFHEDINEFNKMAQKEIERIQSTIGVFTREYPENIIHFSAVPWINLTSLTHSRNFKIEDSCPKISFGKVVEENGQKIMSLAVLAHHGLVDGYHMGLFVEEFQNLMNS